MTYIVLLEVYSYYYDISVIKQVQMTNVKISPPHPTCLYITCDVLYMDSYITWASSNSCKSQMTIMMR